LTLVVIRRVLRIIDIFVLWDFRRGALFGRQLGILIRDIIDLANPRLRRLIPLNLLRPRPPARPPAIRPPLQAPRPLPTPPVQALPALVPPVQRAPAPAPQQPAAPVPARQAPAPAPQPPSAPPPYILEPEAPIYEPDPPIYQPQAPIYEPDPPVHNPGIHGPALTGPEPIAPPPSGRGSCTSFACGDVPSGGTVSEPPALVPQAPSSGGHTDSAPIYDPPVPEAPAAIPAAPPALVPEAPSSGGHDAGSTYDQAPVDVPQDSGSGGSTPPDYGSLPGAGDTGGDPGGNLQCDGVLNVC
jgi:DNA-directed RNA polymerase II subunit RPB1